MPENKIPLFALLACYFLIAPQCNSLNAQQLASEISFDSTSLAEVPANDQIPFILHVRKVTKNKNRQFRVQGDAVASQYQQIEYIAVEKDANRAVVSIESTEAIVNIHPWDEGVPGAQPQVLRQGNTGQFFGIDRKPADPESETLKCCLCVEDIQRVNLQFLSLLKKSTLLFSTGAKRNFPQSYELNLKNVSFTGFNRSKLASWAVGTQNRESLPVSNNFDADFKYVLPWLITEISTTTANDELQSISGIQHYSKTQVAPILVPIPPLRSIQTASGEWVNAGTVFEIRSRVETNTYLKRVGNLAVTASMPSGERYPEVKLLEHLRKTSCGLLITGFQEIDPKFLAMLEPNTPIFKISHPCLSDFNEVRYNTKRPPKKTDNVKSEHQ